MRAEEGSIGIADGAPAEEQVRFVESLLNVTPGILYIYDLIERRNVFTNLGIQRILGYSIPEIHAMGESLLGAIMHPEDFQSYLERILPRYATAKDSERIVHQYRLKDRNGQWRWIESTEVIYKFASDGSPRQILGLGLDITERKHSEQQLKESEYFFKESQRASRTGSYRLDVRSGQWEYSEVLGQIFGIDRNFKSDIEQWIQLVHPEDRSMMMRHYAEEVMAGRKGFDKEYRIVRADDGAVRWVHGLGELMLDSRGEPIHMIGTIRDITEHREAEIALQRSEQRLKLATQAAKIGVWDWEIQSNTLLWDDSMFTLYGVEKSQFGGVFEAWARGLHPADRARIDAAIQDAVEGRSEFAEEFRIVRPDGAERILKAQSRTQRDADGKAVRMIGVNLDITEREVAERRVRESGERLRFAMETSRIGAWDLDLVDHTAFRSPEHDRIFGYEELLPRWTYEMFLEHILPADRQGVDAKFRQALDTMGDWNFECRILRRDGQERWIWAAGRHSLDSTGESKRMAGVVQDITDRKLVQQELERHRSHLEELVHERTAQLEEANRELDSFCHTISHDLRAPLRHLGGFTKLLLDDCREGLSSEGRKYVDTIASAARKMGVLIDDLLEFSRTSRQEMGVDGIDMNVVLQEAMASMPDASTERKIEWSIGALPSVHGDHNLLRQVWANLLQNAIKYSRTRENPRIEVKGWVEDGEVLFSVADNGVGFDMRYAEKLFGVFQRLHRQEEFEGTGIGLAIVHRILHRHGGRIWAKAELGCGATFTFALPKRNEVENV